MGLGDKFNDLTQKAKDFARQHPDKTEQGLDKLGDFVDKQTGGKYSGQIDKGEEMLERRLGEQGPAQQGPTQQGSAQ
ncbi:MAG TPA: antitoxin [Pseudonocardiaceae bacterium]|nr:antitoxin [Pseudonocardiaceae bacterium]